MNVPYFEVDGARVWGATAMALAEFSAFAETQPASFERQIPDIYGPFQRRKELCRDKALAFASRCAGHEPCSGECKPATTASPHREAGGVMESFGELLSVDERRALEFFVTGLQDVSDPKVDRRELPYNASVLAHYAQVSVHAESEIPAPENLSVSSSTSSSPTRRSPTTVT